MHERKKTWKLSEKTKSSFPLNLLDSVSCSTQLVFVCPVVVNTSAWDVVCLLYSAAVAGEYFFQSKPECSSEAVFM